ncbi:EamA family transporter [Paenibacillus sp. NEAU-GSW1]|uniref:EamA family transporter n=1 Tax=Paenibacillus sp. NEAU-GSW1 TaxID=2682486 RepID=UPI0012E1692B|nr:EamA family transporter [Paenibacillus sp. NEAU-GSW1]MUT64346.1 EamA family transporter [Paenibacillus sp. NEAU-GSW1]
MWLILAIGSALLFGLAGWWMKVSQMRGGLTSVMLFGLYVSGTAGFGIHSAIENQLSLLADCRIWLSGLIIGAGSAFGNAIFMKALDHGPASLTSPLTNANIVLVVMLGTFVYGEPLGWSEATGIALLLLAVVLIAMKGTGSNSSIDKQWYLYIVAAILLFTFRNGGLKVTEEIGLPSAPILFVGYGFSLLWFAKPLFQWRSVSSPAAATGLILGLLAGLFSYGGLQMYAASLASGPANLAAPIFATNSLVVAAGAIVVYKERLNALQWFAFLCMIAGLAVIKL